MCCGRYELASGESYFRQGDLGRALKNYLAVEKHYSDMTEDQFDFHSYCLRKMTLRAYVSMLKFQDQLHSHEYFHKAAVGTIRWKEENETKTEKGRSSCQESNLARIFYTCRCSSVGMFSSQFLFDILQEAEERNEDTTSGTSKSGKRQNSRPVDLDPHGKKLLQVPSKLSVFV
ncbi:hypothetical protein B296_00044214 [Ensete ventricosum]|uniref:Uncharacterized protein n=1 Tax=Ensete ventricosum TaxID=4639 RepID=A0A426YZS4_ENSVE|nr:hypothetical protein B296_00044214 [Ensete ventricosum]